jgi:hypothetical protein
LGKGPDLVFQVIVVYRHVGMFEVTNQFPQGLLASASAPDRSKTQAVGPCKVCISRNPYQSIHIINGAAKGITPAATAGAPDWNNRQGSPRGNAIVLVTQNDTGPINKRVDKP